jgi:hypothetical protein
MGIKNLMKLIEEFAGHAIRAATQKNYFNRVMAIDISMALYQFLVFIPRNCLFVFVDFSENG